jgi:hypothetical protein
VQNNHLSRDKALQYIEKYEGEFPEEVLHQCLNYLDLDLVQFNEIVEKHRNNEIWKKEGNEIKLNFKLK